MEPIRATFENREFYRIAHIPFDNWHRFKTNGQLCIGTGEPEGQDQAMLDHFVANEARYYQLVSDYLTRHYSDLLERSEFLDVFDEDDPVYPTEFGDLTEEIMLKGDLFSLMRLTSVILLPEDKNAVSFCFECAWDEEHGLGIVIYNDEVIWCDGEQQAYACLNFPEVLDLDRMYRAGLERG